MDADSSKFEFRTVATRKFVCVCVCVFVCYICACRVKYFQVSTRWEIGKSCKVGSLSLTKVKKLKFVRVVDVRVQNLPHSRVKRVRPIIFEQALKFVNYFQVFLPRLRYPM